MMSAPHRRSTVLLLTFLALAPATPGGAQERPDSLRTPAIGRPAEAASPTGASAAPAAGRPTVRAGSLTPEGARELRVDGVLSEAFWATGESISALTTVEPEEGGVPVGRTVVRVFADPTEIVIGIQCDQDPSGMVAFSKARDAELDDEDHVLIVLDTFGDERSGIVFAINPNGSRLDGLVTAQGDDVNSSWDAVWQGAAARSPRGWSAELRLPIRSLSFKKGLDRWGLNVERRVQGIQETSRWSGARQDFEIFQTSQAGVLSDLPAFDFGFGLTVRPGVVGDLARVEPGTARETGMDASLDVIQKLGPNLTANVTVNTDFGETEADARQTNLSRFDILFPEKRAFFLEGADIFEFGTGLDIESATVLPFFSRRIGLFTPEGEDEGTTVPLRIGTKVQGRVGQTNVGALFVASGRVEDFGLPPAEMGVVRIRQNVFSESSIGMIGTFGDPLDRSSRLGGADFTYRTSEFRGDKNLLAGVWGMGVSADHLEEGRSAFGGRVAYPNDLLNLSATLLRIGDNFQPSLGFVQRSGDVVQGVADYKRRPEGSMVRQFSFGATYLQARNDLGWESYAAVLKPLDVLFESGDRLSGTVAPQGERPTDGFDLFSSPPDTVGIQAGTHEWTRYGLSAELAPRRPVSGELTLSFGGFYGGNLRTVEGIVLIKPARIFSLELTGERNVATLPAGDFTQYLVGARAQFKFTPDLQVTNFVQYDNESRSLGSATRLRWSYHPLGDVFVAFNQNMTRSIGVTGSRWLPESDQLLVKLQHAFRL